MTSSVRMIGDDLIEIAVSGRDQAIGLAATLRATGKFEEVVPALGVVTVQYDPLDFPAAEAFRTARSASEAIPTKSVAHARGGRLIIPVRYGGETGPDLGKVAEAAELTPEEFITLHTSKEYPVAMIGFTPGFAYLGDLDPKVTIGRLDRPRAQVAAGSVGVIKGYSCVYPLAGPGGWPIVGQTDLSLFNAQAEDPFLLRQGMSVRFEAIE